MYLTVLSQSGSQFKFILIDSEVLNSPGIVALNLRPKGKPEVDTGLTSFDINVEIRPYLCILIFVQDTFVTYSMKFGRRIYP